MKKCFFLFCLVIFAVACSKNERNYVVDVELKTVGRPVYAVHDLFNEKVTVDTLFHNGNFFRIKGSSDSISIIDVFNDGKHLLFSMYLQNGHRLRVVGDAADPFGIQVIGDPLNEAVSNFRNKNKELLMRKMEIQEKLSTIPEILFAERAPYKQIADSVQQAIVEIVTKEVEGNRSALYSTALIKEYLLDSRYAATCDSLIQLLNLSAKTNAGNIMRDIHRFQKEIYRGAVDSIAAQFTLNNERDSVIYSGSFRNQPFVLYFWAPADSMGLDDFVTVNKIYDQFGDTAVKVISVAFENDTAVWKRRVLKNKIRAYNVKEPLGYSSELAERYGVSELPLAVVVNKAGRIASRNLKGDSLLASIDRVIKEIIVMQVGSPVNDKADLSYKPMKILYAGMPDVDFATAKFWYESEKDTLDSNHYFERYILVNPGPVEDYFRKYILINAQ